MTALGSNAHIFARPDRRQDLRWCFEAESEDVISLILNGIRAR